MPWNRFRSSELARTVGGWHLGAFVLGLGVAPNDSSKAFMTTGYAVHETLNGGTLPDSAAIPAAPSRRQPTLTAQRVCR